MSPKTKLKTKQAKGICENIDTVSEDSFPVVGIGASAGGLEAMERFFQHMPADSGSAFVVIQHLDPEREGMLVELLQNSTEMKVYETKDQTTLEKNCVYIIPPDKDLTIKGGLLLLSKPKEMRGFRLPIDCFFRSLGLDRKEQSIGLVLSGMGSDGTAGAKVIKENGGLILVQDPQEAKFDSMPRRVIDEGLADIVAVVSQIPEKIRAWVGRDPGIVEPEGTISDERVGQLEKVVVLLRAHTGQDFSQYKRATINRRVMRRMGIHQIRDIKEYAQFSKENPSELDLLFKELLIGVTSFFRDCSFWDQLRDRVIAPMLKARSRDDAFRAWVPACSTGEEAYSLAILIKEALESIKASSHFPIQVFATDLDRDAIDKARLGIFSENIAKDMSDERLKRYFIKEGNGYRICNEIREMVMFAPQNLIMDPPFTRVDILSCRNLLIYFDAEIQRKLIPLFHYSLNPDGVLFLGSAETIGNFTNLFRPISEAKSLIFRRLEVSQPLTAKEFPSIFNVPDLQVLEGKVPQVEGRSLQSLADQLILTEFAPPTALVNLQGDVLYTSGRTGKFLEAAAGKANWNIFAMAHKDLRDELANSFQKAIRSEHPVQARVVRPQAGGDSLQLEVTLKKLDEHSSLQNLVIILFNETRVPKGKKRLVASGNATKESLADLKHIEDLMTELNDAREEARLTREHVQTKQQELLSANEEMRSTNEEMQSTNEELMTSKEEMQSLNEELETVNNELQGKIEELSQTNNDMKNLLDSTGIATIFLDLDLNVRRFTEPATKLVHLIPSDVGRPLSDLTTQLVYAEFKQDTQKILKNNEPLEKEVETLEGRWFLLCLMPYRGVRGQVDGVVITFADITTSKKLEVELRAEQVELKTQLAGKNNSPAT